MQYDYLDNSAALSLQFFQLEIYPVAEYVEIATFWREKKSNFSVKFCQEMKIMYFEKCSQNVLGISGSGEIIGNYLFLYHG